MPPDDRSRVQLRVTAEYSRVTQEIETTFEFLDAAGRGLRSLFPRQSCKVKAVLATSRWSAGKSGRSVRAEKMSTQGCTAWR